MHGEAQRKTVRTRDPCLIDGGARTFCVPTGWCQMRMLDEDQCRAWCSERGIDPQEPRDCNLHKVSRNNFEIKLPGRGLGVVALGLVLSRTVTERRPSETLLWLTERGM